MLRSEQLCVDILSKVMFIYFSLNVIALPEVIVKDFALVHSKLKIIRPPVRREFVCNSWQNTMYPHLQISTDPADQVGWRSLRVAFGSSCLVCSDLHQQQLIEHDLTQLWRKLCHQLEARREQLTSVCKILQQPKRQKAWFKLLIKSKLTFEKLDTALIQSKM